MGTSLIDANYGRSLFVASSVVASTPLALTATPIAGVNPLNVAIVDGSGAQIISFGGGTQYTDAGTPPAHPVGTMPIWNNGGAWSQTSLANGLPIQPATGASFAVTGTFWQATQPVSLASVPSHNVTNAGTFATQATLQTGTNQIGHLEANQSVNVAQINGVTTSMGNGVSGTGVQRVTIASDSTGQVALAAGTNGIGKLTSNSGVTIGAVEIAAAQTLSTVTTVSTVTNQSQEGGVNISLNAGAVDTGTRRVVQANGAGKTIVSKSGSASTSGNNTLVAAGTNKLKVFAFSLSTQSTTAMTCKFQDGASGTDLWSVILQAGTSVSTGANLAVSPPAWLFNTSAATLLNLNLSSANAVQWSVSYFEEV